MYQLLPKTHPFHILLILDRRLTRRGPLKTHYTRGLWCATFPVLRRPKIFRHYLFCAQARVRTYQEFFWAKCRLHIHAPVKSAENLMKLIWYSPSNFTSKFFLSQLKLTSDSCLITKMFCLCFFLFPCHLSLWRSGGGWVNVLSSYKPLLQSLVLERVTIFFPTGARLFQMFFS